MTKWFAVAIIIVIVLVGGYFIFAKNSTAPSTPVPTQTQAQATTVPPDQMTGTSKAMTEESMVTLTSSGFSPASLTVKTGTKVTWKNTSGEAATVNSDPHPTHTDYPPLNLGSFQNGGTLSLIFDKAGTYGYHNHFNPSERGTIIVK